MGKYSIDPSAQFYSQLITEYEDKERAMWCYANPSPRPCFTKGLLDDLLRYYGAIEHNIKNDLRSGISPKIKYLILGSHTPGVFSLGGDLCLFIECIKENDRDRLYDYMRLSIDVLYRTYINMDVPISTIALIRGNALGAGFEGALSCDYIVAEKSVQLGFPEVLFNMFPGMGAYSFLSRRISPVEVDRMILSGRIYAAEELYEMGIIDVLCEDGEGVSKVRKFLKTLNKTENTRKSLFEVKRRVNPVSKSELIDIGNIWVDTAMRLTSRELKIMERLMRSQDRLAKPQAEFVRNPKNSATDTCP
ncbi:MAG: crotonase/enoyl-CoA hydratase family protein [Gammaproteobacteria bacterium]|nr:crotonase/enoyl-CoA hydratase family protein [Gammaproteobacteria bacterium]MDH3559967.1 crotonase/enoyl-CoA hydratase family protein [Gammaproteobacteria bacterium]